MIDSTPTTRADAPHHVEIDGRNWRASDPELPEALRSELVHELMDARRRVGAGLKADDEAAVQRARDRVQDAKVALGERGDAWWEPTDAGVRTRIEAAIRAVLHHRAADATTCPSDAARIAGGAGWRALMPVAREVAFELQERGVTEVRAKGERVPSIDQARGPLRIARGEQFP